MKNEFRRKYLDLEKEIVSKIGDLIETKGEKSKHRSQLVLRVKGDQQFNLEGGRFLTELTETELIDNQGYSYQHSSLDLDNLCEVMDSLI